MSDPAKFVWTITLGDMAVMIAAGSPLIGILLWMARIERKLNYFLVEHEMLVGDYAERKGVKPSDLPTRSKGTW